MKKVYFALITLMIVLSSCASVHWQIGETTQTFLQVNRKASFDMVKSSQEWTVYKWTNNWSYDQPYFFYFHYNQLYQVDRGIRPSDVIIENR